MKIKHSVEINKPIEVVAKYFADPEYLSFYQDGFLRKEMISGAPGEDGSVSHMYYKQGKREMEIVETITANNLPQAFEGFYHHAHMDNTMKVTFTALEDDRTLYESEIEYIRISWIMPKLISILFPGMFRKPPAKWMKNFKDFVENQTTI